LGINAYTFTLHVITLPTITVFLSALQKTGHKIYYLRLERGGRSLEDRPLPEGIEQVNWAGGRSAVSLRDGPHLLTDLKRSDPVY